MKLLTKISISRIKISALLVTRTSSLMAKLEQVCIPKMASMRNNKLFYFFITFSILSLSAVFKISFSATKLKLRELKSSLKFRERKCACIFISNYRHYYSLNIISFSFFLSLHLHHDDGFDDHPK